MRSLAFLLLILVPVLGVWTCVWAQAGGWPTPLDVARFGGQIDGLFDLVPWMAAITFVGMEALLAWVFFKYSRRRPDKAVLTCGDHKREMVCSAIPAVLLLLIAFSQMGTWAGIGLERDPPEGEYSSASPIGELWASQSDWRTRYPGRDGQPGNSDDFEHASELVVPADTDVVFDLRSRDVDHVLLVPEFRLRQRALPGHAIPVRIRAGLRPADAERGESSYDLLCAELCGWGHFKLAASVRVMRRDRFDQWLAEAEARWFSNGAEDAR